LGCVAKPTDSFFTPQSPQPGLPFRLLLLFLKKPSQLCFPDFLGLPFSFFDQFLSCLHGTFQILAPHPVRSFFFGQNFFLPTPFMGLALFRCFCTPFPTRSPAGGAKGGPPGTNLTCLCVQGWVSWLFYELFDVVSELTWGLFILFLG